MSQPTRGRGRGRKGSGGERESWTPREKAIIKDILGPDTEYYKKIHGKATSLQQYDVWQQISVDFCLETGWSNVKPQKLRDMYKKEIAKANRQQRAEYTQLVVEEQEFQIFSKGTSVGPAAPAQ